MPTDPRGARPAGMLVPEPSSAVYGRQGLEFWDAKGVLRFWISRADTRAMVFDDAGVLRAEMGSLDANGVSPAQYGFRASDASGNPIFDSLGLIQHTTSLGHGSNFNTGYTVSSTSDVSTPGCSIPFTLARPTSVKVEMNAVGKTSGGSGFFAYGGVHLDGAGQGHAQGIPTMLWDVGNAGYAGQFISILYTLAAGPHTIDCNFHVDAGQTWLNYQTVIDVYQLGG